jgi:hypothetical protein
MRQHRIGVSESAVGRVRHALYLSLVSVATPPSREAAAGAGATVMIEASKA